MKWKQPRRVFECESTMTTTSKAHERNLIMRDWYKKIQASSNFCQDLRTCVCICFSMSVRLSVCVRLWGCYLFHGTSLWARCIHWMGWRYLFWKIRQMKMKYRSSFCRLIRCQLSSVQTFRGKKIWWIVRGAYYKFPDFFHMGTFIDSTHETLVLFELISFGCNAHVVPFQ